MVPDRRYDFLPQRLLTVSRRNRMRNRLIARLVRRLAVVSQRLGEEFCTYNGIAKSRLRLVPYGVHGGEPEGSPARAAARIEQRASLGVQSEDIVVGSVGRFVEQKDYPTQLRGFALAYRAEPRLLMILIGDGPLRGELEALAAQLGIASRLRFLGFRADVANLFRALDLFVLTSKFEPYGIALLEAKAYGVPIIAAAVNEIPEILSHGRSGRLFEVASAEGFSRALLEVINDPVGTRSMANVAYREAGARHGLQSMIDTYQALYDEVYSETHVHNPSVNLRK
jgi:glycosyltransferase involved in cell wall biosynthesis